jgi:excisionase family DNA binding protein
MTSLLTLSEVADELACSVATVKRRVSAGALPIVRDGRLVRVRASDLELYLLERIQRSTVTSGARVRAVGISVPAGARLWD